MPDSISASLDALLNNAGAMAPKDGLARVAAADTARVDATLWTNHVGTAALTLRVLPQLAAHGGRGGTVASRPDNNRETPAAPARAAADTPL